MKILYIGNSLSYWNGGINRHTEELAGQSRPKIAIRAEMYAKPRATLATLWQDGALHRMITRGSYDAVILQEDVPETKVATFHEFARNFVAEIREAGARPVLYMAWSYNRLGWITMDEIASAHRNIAVELDIALAPVGFAMKRMREENHSIDLLGSDREHPSIHGTYLAVCVVYAAALGGDPRRSTYIPSAEFGTISLDEAQCLRRFAVAFSDEYRSTTSATTG